MSYGDYPDLDKVKKILVIKLRHLGDVLLTTPVFSALKQEIPQAKIHAYVYLEAKPILEDNPYLAKVMTYDRAVKKQSILKKIYYELKLLWKIRREKYDLVINLTEGDRGSLATKVSKAFYRVGMFGRHQKVYTHLVKAASLRHTVEKNLDALRRIGIFPRPEGKKLHFQTQQPASFGIKEFFLIHPTSRWRFKCWPPLKVRALIKALLQRGHTVVVTSGKDQKEIRMIDKILDQMHADNLINLSGQVTLKELGWLIQHTKRLVCVDSFPFHVSSVFQTSVVALFGPTSEITWGPWQNPNAKVITKAMSCRPCFQDGCGGSKRSECLLSIEAEEVLLAMDLESALEKRDLLQR